jgi:hypothetical protein
VNKYAHLKLIAVVVITSLIAPLPLLARPDISQWEAVVRVKLAAAALVGVFAGARLTADPYIGTLNNRTYKDLTITLYRGVEYALIGVCDDDCEDMDMQLYNDDGDLVKEDAQPDATPVVSVVPRRTQVYTIRMIMERCDGNPCFYGLGVFNK